MVVTFLLLLLARLICSHPQCVEDFKPPFKPSNELKFCTDYSKYSCCTFDRDLQIQQLYEYALRRDINSLLCHEFIKDILCLECHPYSAHIYDAETHPSGTQWEKRNIHFPALCKNFCLQYFNICKPLFLEISRSISFAQFLKNSTNKEFCEWATISEKKYCYPNLKQTPHVTKPSFDSDSVICVEPIPELFNNPLAGVHANDGSHRLFVAEQRGTVYIVDHKGVKLNLPFLNITNKVLNSGNAWDERGLLCIVFHPKYRYNGRFYVFYSAENILKNQTESNSRFYYMNSDVIRVSEFSVDPDNPNLADHDSELIIIEIEQPEANHNGGMLFFGEDGYLYVSVGDGGGVGDDHWVIGNGLNISTLLGKILRLDIDVEDELYSVPPDNPFVTFNNVRPEIYAFGLRNSWRCSQDRGQVGQINNRQIFCGDVGQNREEEINIIVKGGNYGWRAYEGFSCYDKILCRHHQRNIQLPILAYNHSVGQSIVGGFVYRGCSNPDFYGRYFYADTMKGRMFYAEELNGEWVSKPIVVGNDKFCNNGMTGNYFQNILSFAENEAGELFILATSFPNPAYSNGQIYRIVDPFRRGNPNICTSKIFNPHRLKRIIRRRIFYATR